MTLNHKDRRVIRASKRAKDYKLVGPHFKLFFIKLFHKWKLLVKKKQ